MKIDPGEKIMVDYAYQLLLRKQMAERLGFAERQSAEREAFYRENKSVFNYPMEDK